MTRHANLLLAILILALSSTPLTLAHDPDDSVSGDDQPTLAALAVEAGAAAGLAEVCKADPAPINSAFRDLLHASYPDHRSRHTIWVQYKTTESSTVSLLANRPLSDCGEVATRVQSEARRLAQRLL